MIKVKKLRTGLISTVNEQNHTAYNRLEPMARLEIRFHK